MQSSIKVVDQRNDVRRFAIFIILLLLISIRGSLPDPTPQLHSPDMTQEPKSSPLRTYARDSEYLIANEDLENLNIQPLVQLKSIPYSIIHLTDEVTSHVNLWPNTKIALDEMEYNDVIPFDYQEQIGIEAVWDKNYDGTGIVVAVVDTGVNFDIPSLQGKMVAEKSFHSEIYGYDSSKGPSDDHGHGTSVASLVAGNDPEQLQAGAYEAGIVNAKLGIENGYITALSLIGALDWVITLDEVDIVTMSLSEPEENFDIDPLEELANVAAIRGKIVVASAGNRGSSGRDAYSMGSPGTAPEAISVGAVTSTNTQASFSSEGPSYGDEAKPDLMAPGTSIKVATRSGGYSAASGTSFSTPIVSSLAALLLQALRQEELVQTPGVVKSILLQSAADLGLNHYVQGFGLVNISAAIDYVILGEYSPIIAPQPTNIDPITLPVNTKISYPISIIGAHDLIDITTIDNIDLEYTTRYSGNTSIVVLEMTSREIEPLEYLTLSIRTSNGDINYILPINIIEEPKFKVLIDLKHTSLDTINGAPVGRVLERTNLRDLGSFTSQILQKGGWVTEFYGNSLEYETMIDYDIVFIPSAFMDPNPAFYDHDYQITDLELDEVFNMYRYYAEGGSIIIDFGGETAYDGELSFQQSNLSKKRLEYLIGSTIINDDQSELYYHMLNPLTMTPGTIITGSEEFRSGIPFVAGNSGYSSIGMISNTGGKIFAHNNRNWRTPDGFNSNFVSNVTDWVTQDYFAKSIMRSGSDISIGISVEFMEIIEDLDIELEIDGLPSEDYQLKDDILQISNVENQKIDIELKVTHLTQEVFRLDTTLGPEFEYVITHLEANETTIISGEIETNYDINTGVARITTSGKTVDAEMSYSNGMLNFMITDNLQDTDMQIEFLDGYGEIKIIPLIINNKIISTKSGQINNSSGFLRIGNIIFLSAILSILIIRKTKKRY